MTLRQIAELIPAEYRREILETNMISKAIAIASDASMHYLGTIWKNYVAEEDLTCGACLTRVLENYRQLQQVFIDMEKESKLLAGL
jgi:hypothetical protein